MAITLMGETPGFVASRGRFGLKTDLKKLQKPVVITTELI